jgi:RNA polymerase sigma-70 factor, ECF subfamily
VLEWSLRAGGDDVEEPDEQRLVSHLRAGRPGASSELIRLHYARVYRLLVHLTRDVHQAEDLTQETFISAWEKIASFRGQATLATWLYRIAYTKFIDGRRLQQRTAGMLERHSGSAASPADPLESVMADDEARRLYRALDQLDAPDRTLLALHYLQGLSYRELATVLEEPSGTVKWRTSEALNRLRTVLNREVPDHEFRRASQPGSIA